MKLRLAPILLLCLLSILSGQSQIDSLEIKLSEIQQNSRIPGFAVALVDQDEIKFCKGFGYSDLMNKTPYTSETIQNIGSVSKTFIALAIVKLMEEGKLQLEDPINKYLPFKISNPRFQNNDITIRHLVSHTSSISDTERYGIECYVLLEPYPENDEMFEKKDRKAFKPLRKIKMKDLDVFIKSFLTTDGNFYKKKNFTKNKPGSHYEYSNIGSALAAYIVELISGQNYADYIRESILQPLEMNSSDFNIEQLDKNKFTKRYFSNLAEVPDYTLISYPDGGMISSCNDLAIYLQKMIQGYGGTASAEHVVNADSYQKMFTILHEEGKEKNAIFWAINKQGRIDHNGADPGIFTWIEFDPETLTGKVFLCNTTAFEAEDMFKDFLKIWKNLEKSRKQLSK